MSWPRGVSIEWACPSCGWRPAADDPYPFRCANAGRDEAEHILIRRANLAPEALPFPPQELLENPEPNPFVRFRPLLSSYTRARENGWSDRRYVELVRELDEAVQEVDGSGFRTTPLVSAPTVARELGISELWIKDETANVAGSHKGRHLMGLALWLEVVRQTNEGAHPEPTPLAIASCGNAALAAAVVARASSRPLEVFVPTHADSTIVSALEQHGARLHYCERRTGEVGDPCFLRYREAVQKGGLPFTCQGPENTVVLDGGLTLGYELAAQAHAKAPLDRLFIQVGGGALASSVALGLDEAVRLGWIDRVPRLHAVQSEGAAPLARAYDRVVAHALELPLPPSIVTLAERIARNEQLGQLGRDRQVAAVDYAATHRGEFLWPWETTPKSMATGILDDETYDWLAVVRAMVATGGYPVVVSETELNRAHQLGTDGVGAPADPTGTAGLAGCLQLCELGAVSSADRVAVLFTGVERQGREARIQERE